MRNTLEYPVTVIETIAFFEKENARIKHEIAENLMCGDMRPRYYDEILQLLRKDRRKYIVTVDRVDNDPDYAFLFEMLNGSLYEAYANSVANVIAFNPSAEKYTLLEVWSFKNCNIIWASEGYSGPWTDIGI